MMQRFSTGEETWLSYLVEDSATQPPAATVLLVHGYGATNREWEAYPYLLNHSWRLVMVDLYCHGESSHLDPAADPSDEDLENARDIALLMKHIGVDKYFVVGHSFGGRLVGLIAGQNKQSVLGAVAITPVPIAGSLLDTKGMIASLKTFVAMGPPGVLAFNAVCNVKPADAAKGISRPFRTVNVERYYRYLKRALETEDYEARASSMKKDRGSIIKALTAPLLFLTSVDDFFIDQTVKEHEEIPGSKLQILNDLGHMFPLSHPKEVAEIIVNFITPLIPTPGAPPDEIVA